VSKIIGRKWRGLTAEERDQYDTMANDEHAKAMEEHEAELEAFRKENPLWKEELAAARREMEAADEKEGSVSLSGNGWKSFEYRIREILEFKKKIAGGAIPDLNCASTISLGLFAQRQRRQYQRSLDGERSGILSKERADALEAAGLIWNLPHGKKGALSSDEAWNVELDKVRRHYHNIRDLARAKERTKKRIAELTKLGIVDPNQRGLNAYEYAVRAFGYKGDLGEFLRDERCTAFFSNQKASSYRNLKEVLRCHKINGGKPLREFEAEEPVLADEHLERVAIGVIEKLEEKYDVFYFSVGGEHKMDVEKAGNAGFALEICRNAREKIFRGGVKVSSKQIHSEVFPQTNRLCLGRFRRAFNAERLECKLIDVANERGVLSVINSVNASGKAIKACLKRSYCECSIYSEVWVSFTTIEKLTEDGFVLVVDDQGSELRDPHTGQFMPKDM